MSRVWNGNAFDEVLSSSEKLEDCPRIATPWWATHHLVTSKIRSERDVVIIIGSKMWCIEGMSSDR